MATHNVGPGQTYARLGAVPPPAAGDLVKAHDALFAPAMDTDTVTGWVGTLANPIVIEFSRYAIYRRTIQFVNCQNLLIIDPQFQVPRNNANTADTGGLIIDGSSSRNIKVVNLKSVGGLVGFQVNDGGGRGHIFDGGVVAATRRIGLTGGNGAGISSTMGIGWDEVDRCVTIVNMDFVDCAAHGLELQGKYGVVAGNRFFRAGREIRGCSAVHVLNSGRLTPGGPGSRPDEGTYWLIQNNVASGTITPADPGGQSGDVYLQDGNGYQADHETRYVYFKDNIATGNDGPGFAVYDGADVHLLGNKSIDNSLDAAGRHVHRGEIVIGTNENITNPSFLNNVDVVENTCVMTRARAVNGIGFGLVPHAIQVTYPAQPIRGRVRFRENDVLTQDNASPASLWRWGTSLYGTDAAFTAAVPLSSVAYP